MMRFQALKVTMSRKKSDIIPIRIKGQVRLPGLLGRNIGTEQTERTEELYSEEREKK